MRATLMFLACMGLGACNSPLFDGDEHDVRLEDVGDAVILSTNSMEPIYYHAVDADLLPYISTAICVDPNSCPMVHRARPVRITRSELSFEGRVVSRVSIAYWRLRPTNGTPPFREDSVRYVQKGF